jgi:hypothetical protein
MKNKIVTAGLLAAVIVAVVAAGCATERDTGSLQAQARISKEQAQQIALPSGRRIKEGELKRKGQLIWSFDVACRIPRTSQWAWTPSAARLSRWRETPKQEAKGKD